VKWAKRRPALAALSGAAALLVATILAVSLWGWGQATRAERAANGKAAAEETARKAAVDKAAAEKGRADAEETARKAAVDKAAAEKGRADEAARRANYIDAHLALEKGTNWIERGDIPRGLLWLARGLEVAPGDATELRHSLRTLLGSWGRRIPQIRTVFPHSGPLSAMALSPDGKVLVTTGGKTAQLWAMATGKPVGAPLQDQQPIHAVAFSPDSKTVVTGSLEGTVQLWNVSTRRPVGDSLRLGDRATGYVDVAFSPDGNLLATAYGKMAQLWEAASGKRTGRPFEHPDRVSCVAFSPDSQTLATGCVDHQARRWDVETAKVVGKPLKHSTGIVQVQFSPDGRTLLTKDWVYGLLEVWDVAKGSTTRAPWVGDGLTSNFSDATFSKDGRFVLTAEYKEGLYRVWSMATKKPVGSPIRHPGVSQWALSPDGTGILTADHEGSVVLWNVGEKTPDWPLPVDGHPHLFSPDGKFVLISNEKNPNTKELWDVAQGKVLHSFPHKEDVSSMAFSSNGKTVVTATEKDLFSWNVATAKPLGQPIHVPDGVTKVTLSPDGQTIFTLGKLKHIPVEMRDPKDAAKPTLTQIGAAVKNMSDELRDPKDWYTHQLWDVQTGKAFGGPIRINFPISAAAFSPDGKTVVTAVGSTDQINELVVRDAATGMVLRGLLQPGERWGPGITGMVFSPDGSKLLTVHNRRKGSGSEARLRDAATGRFLGEPIPLPSRHGARVAFSPDGRTLVTALNMPRFVRDAETTLPGEGLVRLWDVTTGKPRGDEFPAHPYQTEITAVAIRPDGKTFVTASPGSGVSVWNVLPPPEGDAHRIRLWVEVLTGMELDAGRAVVELDAKKWRERWEELQKHGGPPGGQGD
jgi:WD40 repeat protein